MNINELAELTDSLQDFDLKKIHTTYDEVKASFIKDLNTYLKFKSDIDNNLDSTTNANRYLIFGDYKITFDFYHVCFDTIYRVGIGKVWEDLIEKNHAKEAGKKTYNLGDRDTLSKAEFAKVHASRDMAEDVAEAAKTQTYLYRTTVSY